MTPALVNALLALLEQADYDIASGQHQPHRLTALYHVASRCGLRQGELFGLRWQDVDLVRRELHVSGQLRFGQRSRGKTRHAHRTLPLSSETVRSLTWHRQN